MFDLRYHVASLAAVFFALVIGILVGVALASHGLGNAERKKLQADLNDAQASINDLKAQHAADKAETQFAGSAYDAVMANRLRGARVAILFIGSVDSSVRTAIEKTVTDAGGSVARMRAITLPVNGHSIQGELAKHSALASFAVGSKRFLNIGRELATEFVTGKDTSMWDALEDQLVEVRSGSPKRPVDAVVLVRTVEPQTRPASAQLVAGLFRTFADAGVPAVGVEFRGTFPSAVQTYKHYSLSSVDDLDTPEGRVALAVLLAADPPTTGHYGLQETDDAIVPKIPPVPVLTTTTGG
jgi:Copper transport outer membrane protein, MctB